MVNYKQKYLKYKLKYQKISGGMNAEQYYKENVIFRQKKTNYRAEILVDRDIITKFIDTYGMFNSEIEESAKVLCYLNIDKLENKEILFNDYEIINELEFPVMPIYKLSLFYCAHNNEFIEIESALIFKGLGHKLLQDTINKFNIKGILVLEADTGVHNKKLEHGLIKYYNKIGFDTIGIKKMEDAQYQFNELNTDNELLPSGTQGFPEISTILQPNDINNEIENLQYSAILMSKILY